MNQNYPLMFTEGKIGALELKNRIVMPPMGTLLNSITGEANDTIIKYYEERAKGGCGLIITEITRVDEMNGVGMDQQLRSSGMKYASALTRLARTRYTASGAKLCVWRGICAVGRV